MTPITSNTSFLRIAQLHSDNHDLSTITHGSIRCYNGQTDPTENGLYYYDSDVGDVMQIRWTGKMTVTVGPGAGPADGDINDGIYELTDGVGITWGSTSISATRK